MGLNPHFAVEDMNAKHDRGERDTGKDAAIKLVYGLPRKYNRDHAEAFKGLYPLAWASCMDSARHREEHLACEMQRLESTVMINTAADLFMTVVPDTPILTIHDALVVPRSGMVVAKRLIEQAFGDLCGVKPTIKTNRWNT